MSEIPTREEAYTILKRAGCSEAVVRHAEAVARLALQIAGKLRERGFEVDLRIVEVGALLHDLGRSKLHTVNHGSVGGDIARSLGLPESLARIVERHVGAGIPLEEAVAVGLPARSYVPETLEEKIVAYADKLVAGDRIQDCDTVLREYADKLGWDHPAIGRLRGLCDEFSRILE